MPAPSVSGPPFRSIRGSSASLPVLDRGLQYGDGLFETIAIRGGRPCLWERHLERLHAGCRRLGIPCPDPDELLSASLGECAGLDAAMLKIIVTRGPGGQGYRTPVTTTPSVAIYVGTRPDPPAGAATRGVAVRTCDLRLAEQPALAGIKHLNRLEQVLARREWSDPAIHEGLMRDASGRVIEGIASNLLLFRDDRMVTPALDRCGVAGVVRDLALELAPRLGLQVEVRDVAEAELATFPAMALTNSLIGVWPVASLDGRPLDPPDPTLLATLATEAFRC